MSGLAQRSGGRLLGRVAAVALLVLGVPLVARPAPAAALPVVEEPTIPACGARSTADLTLPKTPPPKGKGKLRVDTGEGFNVKGFRLRPGGGSDPAGYYVLADDGQLRSYGADRKLVRTVSLGQVNAEQGFAVDADGNVYAGHQSTLTRYDDRGKPEWSRDLGGQAGAVYGFDSGSGFRIGVVVGSGSKVFDPDGRSQGETAVVGSRVNQSAATGNLLTTQEGYVRLYSRAGELKLAFGTDLKADQAGPFHFYVLNAADQLADETIVVSDTGHGMELFGPDGSYRGVAKYGDDLAGGVTGPIAYASDMAVHDGSVYYPLDAGAGIARGVAAFAVDDIRGYAAQPQGAPGRLGIGAGPTTAAPGNYFRPGQAPKITIDFHPWWHTVAEGLTGEYTIRDLRQLRAKTDVKPTPFTPKIEARGITHIPVQVPSTQPGFYQLDVRLFRDGKVVGADCLEYGIGPVGADFDPSKLGEGQLADVTLTKAFGQRLLRTEFTFDDLLAEDPKAALKFPDDFDARWKALADAAAAAGVTLEVQIGTGSERQKKLVSSGTWGDRIGELVERLKPYVGVWEPWNEPNNTFGNGTDYTNQVLKPAYEAIKKADPKATVVAGGTLGIDLGFIDQLISAGGLDFADAFGIHPYTGHNRSWEEQGTMAVLGQLKQRLSAAGKPDLPIFDTESGFWNSPVSSYLRQGDKLVRKVVLENSVGITDISNFYLDGAFTVDGQHWALWEDKITPGGLAMLNFGVQTRGLVFKSRVRTSVPHTYAALYGPPDGKPTLMIAWADDFSVGAVLRGVDPGGVVDVWGAKLASTPAEGGRAVELSGAPIYAKLSAPETAGLGARETFGPNLALASAGAKASASSSTSVNRPALAIDGVGNTQNKGGNTEGVSAWIQHYPDENPWFQVDLGRARTLDRVLVQSQGIDSVQTGLRSYDVELRNGTGAWQPVAKVRNDFLARSHLVSFPAQTATAVRVTNMSVNFSGYAYGLKPPSWPNTPKDLNADDVWNGQAVIYELEAYAPGKGEPEPEPSSAAETPLGEAPAAQPPAASHVGTGLLLAGGVVAAAGLVLGGRALLARRRPS